MGIAKILLIAALVYMAFVAVAEALIGLIQPDMDGGVRLTTTGADGRESDRMLAGFRFDEKLYVSSNHWLRGWYHEALAEPDVIVEVNGVEGPYRAVPIEGEERERVAHAYRMGFVLRFICGFAPSRFLRLDPR